MEIEQVVIFEGMTAKFHESLRRDEDQLPSERGFALTMGIAFYVLAGIATWHRQAFEIREIIAVALGTIFLVVGYTKPLWLRPLNKAWAKLGHVLFLIMNPIIMLLLYSAAIMPMGVLLRMFGKDPLHRKIDKNVKSYWVVREIPGPPPETMTRQF